MRTRSNLDAHFPDLAEHHETDRQFITALSRGLDVLRCFQPGEGLLGNQEIAEKTNLPKATVSRITYTLAALGYLEFLPKWAKYQLGAPVLSLGYAFLNNFGLRSVARPHMQALADRYNSAVGLGARDRLSILYVDLVRGPGTLTLRLDTGSRLPIARSTTGYAFVAGLPASERKALEEAIRERHPDLWPQARKGIAEARKQYERDGFRDWNGRVREDHQRRRRTLRGARPLERPSIQPHRPLFRTHARGHDRRRGAASPLNDPEHQLGLAAKRRPALSPDFTAGRTQEY
jgi:DNA-binding IclR family transcriptional regulator